MSTGEDMATFLSVAMRATRDRERRTLDVDVQVCLAPNAAKASELKITHPPLTQYSTGAALVCELTFLEGTSPTYPFVSGHDLFAGASAYKYVVLIFERDVLSVVAVEG